MAENDSKILAEERPDDFEQGSKGSKKISEPLGNAATPYRYDPAGRFSGQGVFFKAKLFGTADVNEPRGDNVCNVAIGLLKSAVKTTGEHKQRIIFRVNFSGITLQDATNQATLYEHPVNKISFISKDPNDNRAFGYIVTEKEGKHMYFGIKTEKAAEQVVLALRDMFQAVFDKKKKEAADKAAAGEKKDTVEEAAKPAVSQAPAAAVPTTPTTEPVLGEAAAPAAKTDKSMQRENSDSHLLELLGDLSFNQPAPQPATQAQAWPPQNAASLSWGNAVQPAKNDPFAVQQQPNMFAQQQQQQMPAQNMAFQQPQQQQQMPAQNMAFQQPQQQQQVNGFQQQTFGQPMAQSPFSQPFSQPPAQSPAQQPMFGGQPQPGQIFSPQAAQPMFGAPAQQQQAMFQQPGLAQPSPFAQQAAPVQQSPFTNDPFSTTNVFQQPPAPAQPAAQPQNSNPFAAGGQSFGVLQPQQVPQPLAQTAQGPAMNQPGHLFSDLNPLPTTNQQLGRDQFFNDVKNPPKPKLNEIPIAKAPEQAAAPNNTVLW